MSVRYFYCCHMGLCGKVLRGSSNPLGFVICGYLNSADSLLTCVLLQLGEGGCTTPPSFVTIAIHSHCSHSQRGGWVHHPPSAADKQGGGGSTTPPSAADKQGVGGSTTPPQLPTNRAEWVHNPLPPASNDQEGRLHHPLLLISQQIFF